MSAPTFSVIIPTYNRAGLVAEAVRSVLHQTVKDREVIVVDDGSTDNTREVLSPYMERIRYISQENRGIAGARNRGIREARGEFIGFLDSDDMWRPGLLDAVLRTFDEHPQAGAVFIAEREMDERGNVESKIHTKRTRGLFFTPAGMVGKDTGVGCGRPPVVRRAVLDVLGGFDESLKCAVDCDLWIRGSFHAPMVLLPEPLVLRRVHRGNLSEDRAMDAEDWLKILEKLSREHPEFLKQHPLVYRRALGKQRLRLGRELLVRCGTDHSWLPEARRALVGSIRVYPLFARAWIYLAWSLLAPTTYAGWRRRELGRR